MNLLKLPYRIRASIASRIETRRWKAHEASKQRQLSWFSGVPVGPIFIFGCQRSGTTHLEKLFRSDPRSRVFGEFSQLSVTPEHTVWQEEDAMRKILEQNPGAYWVVRSLLASHDILDVLQAWPDSTAIWLFRDANSVADSMIRKWGGDFREISERVETSLSGQWVLKDLWDEIEGQAATLAPNANGEDYYRNVYALYWAARNRLVFDLELPSVSRVLLVDYMDYTRNPEAYLEALWSRIGVRPPEGRYPLETRYAGHSGKTKPRFSPLIQDRCDALYAQLCEASLGSQDAVRST